MREIVVNEGKKSYYKNVANVHDIIYLGTEHLDTLTDKYQTTNHVRNICIYQNGYIKFNNFIRTTGCFSKIFKYQKGYQKSKYKGKSK